MELCKAPSGAGRRRRLILLMDPVGVTTPPWPRPSRSAASSTSSATLAFEDPLPTTDIDGLVELAAKVDVPLHIGEFIFSPYNYGEYIRRGANRCRPLRRRHNVGRASPPAMKIRTTSPMCFGLACVRPQLGHKRASITPALIFQC